MASANITASKLSLITKKSFGFFVLAFGFSLLTTVFISLFIGPEGISEPNTLRTYRVFASALVGASLGVSGAALQALLQNPLADPYIIGVSGGSALGGALALVLFGTYAWSSIPLLSFLGAVLVCSALTALLRNGISTYVLLLAGVLINAFAAAFITVIKVMLPADKAQILLFWLVGSVDYLPLSSLLLFSATFFVSLYWLMKNAGALQLLVMGEEEAKRLGVDTNQTIKEIYFSVSLLTGVSVAFAGMIGFVGLVVPQVLRMRFGLENRLLLPLSALAGGIFLTIGDSLSRLSFCFLSSEVPAGAFTALFGAPIFAWLLFKRRASL